MFRRFGFHPVTALFLILLSPSEVLGPTPSGLTLPIDTTVTYEKE